MRSQFYGRTRSLLADVKAAPDAVRSRNFSQYAEDSILYALFDVGPDGLFVDVGAHDPKFGSNTYRLYRSGWSGLTIEPNPQSASRFRALRPRDTHLTLGVSPSPSVLSYHAYDDSVLNTFSEARVDQLLAQGLKPHDVVSVETRPLSDILASELQDRQIGFMSIDCEGFDLEVLQSNDFSRFRPIVLCIEDFDAFSALRSGSGTSRIAEHLRAQAYVPVAQALYSTIYVTRGWRDLLPAAHGLTPRQSSLLP